MSKHIQLLLTRVTGASQSRLKCFSRAIISLQKLNDQVWHYPPSMVLLLAHHQKDALFKYCSLAKPDSRTKSKSLVLRDKGIASVDKNVMAKIY